MAKTGIAKTGTPQRIVLATIGSLGDLHPMLALGLELKRRGHLVSIASSSYYRERIEGLGFGFHPLRPNWDPTDAELIAQCEDIRRGPEVLFRQLVLPHLRDTYEDLHAAVANADLMLAGELVYAAPLVAEKLSLPWASVILSPTSFFSAYDPSLLVNIPSVYRLRTAGPWVNRALLNFGKVVSRHWWKPVRQLRGELGLRVECDPVFRDKFAPELVLALFSRVLAQAQPDWPRQTVQPGFVFYDGQGNAKEDSAALHAFLDSGEAPIVFTQGSTAVHNAGSFYETSAAAAKALGRRALLIGAKDLGNEGLQQEATGRLLSVAYANYAEVFPRAAAIVHQGGSGTTGQALRAGKPQLIVPYGWDQPDNGERVARLGAGVCLARTSYTPEAAAAALWRLLGSPESAGQEFAKEAARAAGQIRGEDALVSACDTIERIFVEASIPSIGHKRKPAGNLVG